MHHCQNYECAFLKIVCSRAGGAIVWEPNVKDSICKTFSKTVFLWKKFKQLSVKSCITITQEGWNIFLYHNQVFNCERISFCQISIIEIISLWQRWKKQHFFKFFDWNNSRLEWNFLVMLLWIVKMANALLHNVGWQVTIENYKND